MNLTSKQRKHLESLAHELDPIVRIGKNGVTPTLIRTADEALQARELIKVKLLDNAALDKHEVAAEIVAATEATLVRVIGNIIVLYRQNLKRKYHIQLDGQPQPEATPVKKPLKRARKPAPRRTSRPMAARDDSPRPPRASPWAKAKGPRQVP
ncbi:MAG TPA: ribosome assembly RNA-binding protein YhbY, partial [Candidatus Ozemobacteraceae bacterium]|nr:ribosome assembly RNA-binding protein YhbY [Candidatus Ozemobacteraceae bacterium]